MKNGLIFKTILTIIFMIFMLSLTINILYKSIKLTNEEYINLLLNDSFPKSFYSDVVNVFTTINPLDLIELPEVNRVSLNSSDVVDPIIYIYSDDDLSYKKDYNYTPTTSLVAYLISDKLNSNSVSTSYRDDIYNLKKYNNINDLSVFLNKDSKYKINISRDDFGKNIKINSKKYALINLYANENNASFIIELSEYINSNYPHLSKIYLSSDDDIKICVGHSKSDMPEILNSIDVLVSSLKEIV